MGVTYRILPDTIPTECRDCNGKGEDCGDKCETCDGTGLAGDGKTERRKNGKGQYDTAQYTVLLEHGLSLVETALPESDLPNGKLRMLTINAHFFTDIGFHPEGHSYDGSILFEKLFQELKDRCNGMFPDIIGVTEWPRGDKTSIPGYTRVVAANYQGLQNVIWIREDLVKKEIITIVGRHSLILKKYVPKKKKCTTMLWREPAKDYSVTPSRNTALARLSCQGKEFTIALVHLTGGKYDDENYKQLSEEGQKSAELRQIVEQCNPKPDIIFGDFNSPHPESLSLGTCIECNGTKKIPCEHCKGSAKCPNYPDEELRWKCSCDDEQCQPCTGTSKIQCEACLGNGVASIFDQAFRNYKIFSRERGNEGLSLKPNPSYHQTTYTFTYEGSDTKGTCLKCSGSGIFKMDKFDNHKEIECHQCDGTGKKTERQVANELDFVKYMTDGHEALHEMGYRAAYHTKDIGATSYYKSTVDWFYYKNANGISVNDRAINIEMMKNLRYKPHMSYRDPTPITDHNSVMVTFDLSQGERPPSVHRRSSPSEVQEPQSSQAGEHTPAVASPHNRRLGEHTPRNNGSVPHHLGNNPTDTRTHRSLLKCIRDRAVSKHRYQRAALISKRQESEQRLQSRRC